MPSRDRPEFCQSISSHLINLKCTTPSGVTHTALRTASACRIADLTVHVRGDRMSDYDTGILLETGPEACPWTID
jgi:hypothetical protein